MSSAAPLRILLVNDDGPPAPHSPHIFGLYQTLIARGHSVTVVIPSSQKSWGAMAFNVSGQIGVWWYYPRRDDNGKGEWCTAPRPLKEGEEAEWVLVDGSPTTCANVGLFNQSLYAPQQSSPSGTIHPFDLVLSGPNFGRNTGAAFCLSSGTLGAALAASMSNVKAIALSYGHFSVVPATIQKTIDASPQASDAAAKAAKNQPDPAQKSALEEEKKNNKGKDAQGWKNVAPVAPRELVQIAHDLSVDIVERLYGSWEDGVGVYGINVPLAWTLKDPKVYWTVTWRNKYPQLFKAVPNDTNGDSGKPSSAHLPADAPEPQSRLVFQPEMSSMMAPPDVQVGTDACEYAVLMFNQTQGHP